PASISSPGGTDGGMISLPRADCACATTKFENSTNAQMLMHSQNLFNSIRTFPAVSGLCWLNCKLLNFIISKLPFFQFMALNLLAARCWTGLFHLQCRSRGALHCVRKIAAGA